MICSKCGYECNEKSNFCKNCGNQLQGIKIDNSQTSKNKFYQTVVLFILIVLVVVLALRMKSHFNLLSYSFTFDGILLAIVILFLFFDIKGFFRLFRIRIRIKPIIQILLIAPLIATLVLLFTKFINNQFNLTFTKSYILYQIYSPNLYVYGLLCISILPGFIEEMLFRNILFNNLLIFTRPKTVIFITGLLFYFVHFSLLSILWLFPIGIILGYFRFRYRTIWYSILFHCLYNASIYILEMYI